jgi:mannose-6-phosphate isomerase-like protein (cupin superfamily)
MSGVRVAIVVFGPTKDQPTAGAAAVPAELAGMMDAEGTHRTDTVDVGVVISGSILLRVPGQPDVRLRQGDTFVQAGAAHSWRNDGEEPCEVVITMIGAHGERADGT